MRSIIWNLTRACGWNCSFCCMSAKHRKGMGYINGDNDKDAHFEEELSFHEKQQVIDQLKKGDFRLDLSGGDLLIDPLNIDLILYASEKLGRENVGISVTGAFITEDIVNKLSGKIKDVEISMDYVPFEHYRTRPVGYHEYAGNATDMLRAAGIPVGIQTVLTRDNLDRNMIRRLYNWLLEHDVNEWSLLRFFPSGRGKMFRDIEPTYQEYCEIVSFIKDLTKENKIKISFQYLLPNHEGYTLDCRAVRKSIGILPNGLVTGCFWGLDEKNQVTDKSFELGKVPEMNIYDILKNDKSKKWLENGCTCRIFTYDDLEKCSDYKKGLK